MSNIKYCPFLSDRRCERVRKHSNQPLDPQFCIACLMGRIIDLLSLRIRSELKEAGADLDI